MRMKSKKQLTMALALTLALGGGSAPAYAESIQNQILIKGDWALKEELHMKKSTVTADNVSLDGSSIQAVGSPVMIVNSSLEGEKALRFLNFPQA